MHIARKALFDKHAKEEEEEEEEYVDDLNLDGDAGLCFSLLNCSHLIKDVQMPMYGMQIRSIWSSLLRRYIVFVSSFGTLVTLYTLLKQGQRLRERDSAPQNGIEEDDEDEDEDEGDDDWADDEIAYISPIDNVDVYVSFKSSLEGSSIRAHFFTLTESNISG